MHGRIFTLMSWVILMTTLVTSCTSGGGGASQGSSTQPVVDASGKKTYTVDPATGATLSAAGISSSDPSFANAGVVIPPGSLSIPVNISIFQAQSLVGSSTASAVGSNNLTAAGPAVAVLPSQAVSITNPLAISIPFSLLTSLTGNKQIVVIAIYPGESKNELETFVGDELDLGTSGVVKLSITRFGAFQVVYSDNEVAKQKVETEIKIEQKTSTNTVETGGSTNTSGGSTNTSGASGDMPPNNGYSPSDSGGSTNFQPTFTLTGPDAISPTSCAMFTITAISGDPTTPVSFSLSSYPTSDNHVGGAFYSAENCNQASMLTPQSTQSITIESGETSKSFYFKPDWTNGVLTNGVISISVQNIMNNQILNSIDVTVSTQADTTD